ncbi:F-box protein At2g02240 [Ziziphus jujuba]|uniref:F-box protein At2g02240 n=2 Tax=Ziziphus jujuba TaxID=326968 RepID=A0A6P4AG70_ZIZJJ|nr:F-box protein At2g02240 [Ziziphus jujuba]KAH7521814.1 hypothetical protein FEM48_Zijuj07G0072100 [Ziziphus jujuba var. spinosa]
MDSDAKWESRLPKNYRDIISRSDSASYLNSLPKEGLYNHFCNHPTIIDNGTKSFAIDKKSGKSCYMIGARGLEIEHVEKPQYWQWKSLPVSRFSEVAELNEVWFLHIKGKIEKMMLPPGTTYGVYFVYKLTENISVFRRVPVELSIDFNGQVKGNGPNNYLDPLHPRQNDRGDGWREIEMGDFFIKHGENDRLVFMLKEYDTKTRKNGLIVEGIEIRPKHG